MSDTSSEESSDSEAQSSQAASTHEQVAHSALAAALQSRDLKKLIDEPNWHDKDKLDFLHRTVVQQYRYPAAQGVRERSESPNSDTSSMAVSIHTHSTPIRSSTPSSYAGSSYTPSLGSYPTARSGSSVRTSRADSLLEQHLLEVDETGVAQAPSSQNIAGRLACPFSFLECRYRSDNLEEWDVHSQSHLRGYLPKEVHCPFKCAWTNLGESGAAAWRQRILHIVADHPDDEVDTNSRPKQSLIDHLWRHRLIDDAQKKELIRHGRLTGSVFTSSSGPVRHGRMQRRPGGTGS